MVGVLKYWTGSAWVKIPINSTNVVPDENYVFFQNDLTLTLAAHQRTIIVNDRGDATVTEVTIDPVALGSTFHAIYRADTTDEVTDFIVPSGVKLEGVIDGKFRASRTLNNEVIIRVKPNGDVTLFGNISKQ